MQNKSNNGKTVLIKNSEQNSVDEIQNDLEMKKEIALDEEQSI